MTFELAGGGQLFRRRRFSRQKKTPACLVARGGRIV